MRSRLRKLRVFVKDGKYYLSEERLKQLEKTRGEMLEARSSRRNLFVLRMARVTVGILLLSLLLGTFTLGIPVLELFIPYCWSPC